MSIILSSNIRITIASSSLVLIVSWTQEIIFQNWSWIWNRMWDTLNMLFQHIKYKYFVIYKQHLFILETKDSYWSILICLYETTRANKNGYMLAIISSVKAQYMHDKHILKWTPAEKMFTKWTYNKTNRFKIKQKQNNYFFCRSTNSFWNSYINQAENVFHCVLFINTSDNDNMV